ncbi:MAG: hypothetical protein HUJ56_09720 [Erysipelotrichaceae bacterium]|nr:hypothetical protein [Erysipelotrichaceae bacterium]
MNENYLIRSSYKGYYDPKVIYSSVGYWPNDLYRIGIVYIMSNNELTPVFNIRGGIGITEYQENDNQYTKFKWKNGEQDVII